MSVYRDTQFNFPQKISGRWMPRIYVNTLRIGEFTLCLKTVVPLLGEQVERASFLHRRHLSSTREILSTKEDSVFLSPSPNPAVRPK